MKDTYTKHKGKERARNYKNKMKKLMKKNKKVHKNLNINSSNVENKEKPSKYQPLIDIDDEDEELPDWNDLTNKDKLKLFSTWSIVSILAYIFLITGSLFLIFNTKTESSKGELFLGLGAMLTWFSLMKFYQNNKGFNTISNTLENSFEIVIKALTGIMPIFIGFGMLGTSIFWRSYRFQDFNTSMFTLFAVMNGDMIWDAWHDIDTINFLFAQIFLYAFILFSI